LGTSAQKEKPLKKIRIALIGAGEMANRYHYPSLSSFEEVELVGICDLLPEKLEATADRFEIEKRYSSYQKMIEETAPDAVTVLVSPHHLFDIVMHCLAEKVHVYLEKPPGVSTYQTKAMAMKAEENGLHTMVAFNRRYMPMLGEAKAMVQEKGPITQCVATFYKNALGRGMYFQGAVDILHCDAVHAVDTLRYLAGGEAVKVASSVRSLFKPYPDSWLALVEFENGCVGVLLTNWAAGSRIHTFEIHGRGISAFLDWDNPGKIFADGQAKPVWQKTPAEAAGDDWDGKMYGYYQENRAFVDCLLNDTAPMTSLSDSVKSMELCDQIYRNAFHGV
jgi:virulence factor